MTPGLLPLLLLLLAGPPSAQPAPPTCYSRMLTLSREVAGDFQSLQATEPSVSPLPLPSTNQEVQCRPHSPKLACGPGKTKKPHYFSFLAKGLPFIPILLSTMTVVCIFF